MRKVFIDPTYLNADRADGGIRRVSDALREHLPQFGYEAVFSADEADIIHNHGSRITERPGKPMVSTCHGLYWSEYQWPQNELMVNKQVTEGMLRADRVVAVSRWVRGAIVRGTLLNPSVIYHGVNTQEFAPPTERPYTGYIFWGKARADVISDPKHVPILASLLPERRFVSTILPKDVRITPNVKGIGVKPYGEIKNFIAQADMFLADVRETMGIQTLEALACGVPVVGWDYGGQSEIIIQNETGILVPYGDYQALANAVEAVYADRQRFSENARADAVARWQWTDKVQAYAQVYDLAIADVTRKPDVSIIVTCHNLAQFLPDALQSVLAQTTNREWECIIVDDASADNTPQVSQSFVQADPRFKYVRSDENIGLSMARNLGFTHSAGKYVCNLDADDAYSPVYVEALAKKLDNDSSTHITYGGLTLINEQGEGSGKRNDFPGDRFSWVQQMAHLNQAPSAIMMRRRVWELSGGYRKRDWRAEDASWLSRVTSFGFKVDFCGVGVVLRYRIRSGSKSQVERAANADADGNWLQWLPWRLANDARSGLQVINNPQLPYSLVPWGARSEPPAKAVFWNVPHRASPDVSVIIPVGPGHTARVIDAVESVMSQGYTNWEIVVINDTGEPWTSVPGAPYARVVTRRQTDGLALGPGAARNVGAQVARGQWLFFLDADDIALPDTLTAFMYAAKNKPDAVIYGDTLMAVGGKTFISEAHNIVCRGDIEQGPLYQMRHSVSALVPRLAHLKVGGFREDMKTYEDWHYFAKLYAIEGLCGIRVPIPAILYRKETGGRRELAESNEGIRAEAKDIIYRDFREFFQGVKIMGCGPGCGDTSETVQFNGSQSFRDQRRGDTMAKISYKGTQALRWWHGNDGRKYRAGAERRIIEVDPDDVALFINTTVFGEREWELFKDDESPVSVTIPQVERMAMDAPHITLPTNDLPILDIRSEKITVPIASPPQYDIPNIVSGKAFEVIDVIANTQDAGLISAILEQEGKGAKRKTVIEAANHRLGVLFQALDEAD